MLTMKDIVEEGNPILRVVTDKVATPLSEEDQRILRSMIEFLKHSQDEETARKYELRPGVGLSANQIGLNKRMSVVCFTDEKDQYHEYTLINPEILHHSDSTIYLLQGEECLSVNRVVPGFVPRYESIEVKACDINGEAVTLGFTGILSIIVQHEIDHLNGIMFYDHFNNQNLNQLSKSKPI